LLPQLALQPAAERRTKMKIRTYTMDDYPGIVNLQNTTYGITGPAMRSTPAWQASCARTAAVASRQR
jgi:hypothetical protein